MSVSELILGRPAVKVSRSDLILRLEGLLTSAGLVWLAVALYRFTSYYRGLLTASAQRVLLYIAIGYTIYLLAFYGVAAAAAVKRSKGVLTAAALKKLAGGLWDFIKTGPHAYTRPWTNIKKAEKRALLFNLVKLFFTPLMILFLIENYTYFKQGITNINGWHGLFTIAGFNGLLFPLLLAFFILVDTAFYAFGYVFEAGFLNNKIRSVEPTVLGWAVALVCYAPFNGILSNYANWYANDYASFASSKATFLMRLGALILMGIYASASVALGPRASNLTNRGIVGYGPYGVVRHPAYVTKNAAWWLTVIPVMSLAAALSMAVWSFIYFMRAITEERHLAADPDYVAYCQKVKYRFIPGVL